MTCTYSKDEIGKCLHFILLDCNEDGQADEECSEKRSTEDTNSKEVNSTARGASWWPCLRSDNPQKIIDICAQVGYLQDGTLELELADVAMDFFLNADYSTTDENVSLAVLLGGRTMPLPTNASRFILNMDGNLTSRPYKGSTSQLFQLGARCRTDVALREAIQDMRLFAPAYARPKHSNKRTAVASQEEDDSAKKRAKSSNDGTQKCPPSSALTENGPVPVAKPADTIPAPAGEASLPVKAATNEATIDKVNVAPTETPDVPSTAAAVSAVGVVRVDKSTTAAANASTNQPNVGAPSTSAQAALTAEASAPTDADKASTAQKALTNSPSSNDTGVAMNTEAAFADNSSVEKQLTSKVTDGVADESDIRGTAANTSEATNEINTPLTRASKQRQENQTGSAKNSTSAKVIKSRPSTTKAKTKKGTIARSTPKSVALKNNAPSTASSVDLIELEKPDFKTIKPLLEKVGYTFHWKKKQFCRPVGDGGQAFLSKENFRRDLCAYGVTCNCGNADIDHGCECWTDTEAYDIHRWVRYAVIGGTCQSTCVPLIQSNDAKLLLLELGFSEYHFVSKGWFSPGIALPGFNQENGVEGESFFHARKDLWNHLGRFGLPETCNFDEMSPEDRLKLEFHLSANYRDTL